MEHPINNQIVRLSPKSMTIAIGLVAIGGAFAAAGIYVGETDDAPGAALLGIVLMIGALILAARVILRRPNLDGEKGLTSRNEKA
jgi:hypothetical protein